MSAASYEPVKSQPWNSDDKTPDGRAGAQTTVAAPALEIRSGRATIADHRRARRAAGHGDVWLVNHFGRTILRCPCVNISVSGMRLHVPAGYGVAAGQRYELTSQIPGEEYGPGLAPHRSHWGTIVWARTCTAHGARFVDVGIALE